MCQPLLLLEMFFLPPSIPLFWSPVWRGRLRLTDGGLYDVRKAGAFENALEEVTFELELHGDGGIGAFKIV